MATRHLICSPPRDGEYASYALDTAILVLSIKGGTTSFKLPTSWGSGGTSLQGMLAALQPAGVQQWATVSVNVGGLAGGMAAIRNGGLYVLMAEENGGSGGDTPPPSGKFKPSGEIVLGLHMGHTFIEGKNNILS